MERSVDNDSWSSCISHVSYVLINLEHWLLTGTNMDPEVHEIFKGVHGQNITN